MNNRIPKVSIGLPVYNGEQYSYNLTQTNSKKAYLRFADLILKRHGCFQIFGLILARLR